MRTKWIRGQAAIELAKYGAPLFVFNEQTGWVPAPTSLARALRMPIHALWIYGVHVSSTTSYIEDEAEAANAIAQALALVASPRWCRRTNLFARSKLRREIDRNPQAFPKGCFRKAYPDGRY